MPAFTSRRRHGGRWWGIGTTLAAGAVALLFVMTAGAAKPVQPPPPNGPYQVPTGPVGQASGFADSDGNTTATNSGSDYNPATSTTNVGNQPLYDWNSLTGGTNPTYTGNAPYQTAGGTTDPTTNAGNGWLWLALTDAQKSNTDTGFAGGVKEDDNCPAVVGGSAPNKDDLKRAYFAATTLTAGARAGHTILNLAWVRIPQNTTSPSAHIAFEFNQNSPDATTGSPCGGNSDGLVNRKGGDLLVLYDFTGGASIPTITIDRWVTSGPCDVSSHSSTPNGCWGPGTTLTGTQAEANVDTGLSHVCDTHSNPTPSGTFCDPGEVDTSDGLTTLGSQYVLPFQTSDSLANPTDTLAASEFGEAGIDLTAANIFTSASCISFGQVNAVSRTSGDSGTAAMEDLVGPGSFTLSNCTTGMTTTPLAFDGTNYSSFTGSLSAGTSVKDSATVTVSPVTTWSGNVKFYLCYSATSISSCTPVDTGQTGANQVGSAVAISDATTNHTVTSSATTVSNAGYYCWAAKFLASSPTGLPDKTVTTGECFTVTAATSISTRQYVYPQDKARVTVSSGGALAGTVHFRLFQDGGGHTSSYNCLHDDGTASAVGLLHSEDVAIGDGTSTTLTAHTNNTTHPVNSSTAGASTGLYWNVSYSSTNTSQTGSSSTCTESTAYTFSGDDTTNITATP